MKCFIVLSLVALCYSYPYGTGYGTGYGYSPLFGGLSKNVFVNQDGSLSLITGAGKTITISKVPGQSNVVITTIPSGGVQQYWSKGYWPTQVDPLSQILIPYQGDVSQQTFQQLLGDINSAVQSGQLSDSIYQVMQKWNQWGSQLPNQQLQQELPLYDVPQQTVGIQGVIPPVPSVGQQGQVWPWESPVYGGLGVSGQQPWKSIKYGTGYPLWKTLSSGLWSEQVPQYGSEYPLWKTLSSGAWSEQVPQYGSGYPLWKTLSSRLWSEQVPQYSQYPVSPVGQIIPGQLSQIMQNENEILNQQYQIQQQQSQQQQQLLAQQLQQQQQQKQQQYIQQLQQQVQQEQEQVLDQQQQQYITLWKMLKGLWQQQPGVFPQEGLYGAYGQGMQGYNMPMVW